MPQFNQEPFHQTRRYSDFLWLHEQLLKSHPGVIIPPIPEKKFIGSFDAEFVEARMRALERFLQRIAAHPILRQNQDFKAFLEEPLEPFNRIKEASKNSSSTLGSGSASGIWQWATGSSGNRSTNSDIYSARNELLEDTRQPNQYDIAVDEARKYIDGFEVQIQNVHKHAVGLVKRNKDMSKNLLEFGIAFTSLSQSESDNLRHALNSFGESGDKHAGFASKEADDTMKKFEEPINDYVRLCKAVRQALDVQVSCRNHYDQMLSDLRAKKAHYNKLQSSENSSSKSIEQALASLNETNDKARQSQKEYESISRIVINEIERFKREKLEEFKKLVLGFVESQIEYNHKVEAAWRAVLPELKHLSAALKEQGNRATS